MSQSPRPDHATMSCLDCSYALDGLTSHHCPECGGEFDPNDRATFRRILSSASRIGSYATAEAEVLCMMLERHGIPAATAPETGGVIMYAPLPQASVWVNSGDRARAIELIKSSAETLDRDAARADWTCPTCHEQVEGAFEVCWNCGSERPNE